MKHRKLYTGVSDSFTAMRSLSDRITMKSTRVSALGLPS
jgi:hypothetical protein